MSKWFPRPKDLRNTYVITTWRDEGGWWFALAARPYSGEQTYQATKRSSAERFALLGLWRMLYEYENPPSSKKPKGREFTINAPKNTIDDY